MEESQETRNQLIPGLFDCYWSGAPKVQSDLGIASFAMLATSKVLRSVFQPRQAPGGDVTSEVKANR